MKKIMISEKKFCIFLIFIAYLSYFLGFFLDENSIGSGGYKGDLSWMWKNFEIFKNNTLLDSITHNDFFGNRTPLLYLINFLFNPFINDIYLYRLSIFIFSLLGPIIFYHCLILRFRNTQKEILMLISSIVLLSPFYRTTAYWGMEINYAIISMLLTYYFYLKIDFKSSKIKYHYLFAIIFFSSLVIYFDQKFVFIPIVIFFKVLTCKINLEQKFFMMVSYIMLSLPYLFLIYTWEGIVPSATQNVNQNTITKINRLNLFHLEHLGYASTMIAFYILPLLIFFKKNISFHMKNFFTNKLNYLFITLSVVYLFFVINNLDFQYYTGEKHSRYNYGLGITHKVSILFFENLLLREFFTYISFFISWVIICFYIEKKIMDILIFTFFFIISLFLFPIMQEYFDLVITLTAILLLQNQFEINYKRAFIFYGYFATYLIGCIMYYL